MDKINVRYLEFDVLQSGIRQNNALICIYKDGDGGTVNQYDTGEAIWSWHIWTTNDPTLLSGPIAVTNYTDKEYDFFPLYNLGWIDAGCYPAREDVKIVLAQKKSGKEIEITVRQSSVISAASKGCYYQWGSKDPMCSGTPANGTFNMSSNTNGTSLGGSVRNPDVFYKGSDSGNTDWLKDNHYYNLWTGKESTAGTSDQNDNVIKTVYDPSPIGYKMPASKAFTGFTSDGGQAKSTTNFNVAGTFNNGWCFYTKPGKQGNTVFFPAAGQRVEGGTSQDSGTYGRYWSASPNADGYGYGLRFEKTNEVHPTGSSFLARGFSVRPVKE